MKPNVLVVPSCHSSANNNDGWQSHHLFFDCPNLLVLRLLSLHQHQLAGSEEAGGLCEPSGAREKLAGSLEGGKAEVWTSPWLFSISEEVRWERKWRVWRDGRMAGLERAGRGGPCLIKRADPIPKLELSHIDELCHVTAIVPRLSGNLSPSFSGTVLPAKPPQRDYRQVLALCMPSVSHW